MSVVKNRSRFIQGMHDYPEAAKRMVVVRMWEISNTLETMILAKTPVHTGSVIANFQWSVGSSFLGVIPAINNGPTGATNKMPLGSEPRRAPNAEVSKMSLQNMKFKMGDVVYLTNNDPDYHEVEAGVFPPPPFRVRSSAMASLAIAFVKAKYGV